MTAIEVAVYLRLCTREATPDEALAATRAVRRLVRTGQLVAMRPGREYVFWQGAVDAYIARPLGQRSPALSPGAEEPPA